MKTQAIMVYRLTADERKYQQNIFCYPIEDYYDHFDHARYLFNFSPQTLRPSWGAPEAIAPSRVREKIEFYIYAEFNIRIVKNTSLS